MGKTTTTTTKANEEEIPYKLHEIALGGTARFYLSSLLNSVESCKGKPGDTQYELAGEIYEKIKLTKEESERCVFTIPGRGEEANSAALEALPVLKVKFGLHAIRMLINDVLGDKQVRFRQIDRDWLLPLQAQLKAAVNDHD